MVRSFTPQSSLENLKREAKRWLRALTSGTPEEQRTARDRLHRAVPNAPESPRLRDIHLALAREHGFGGWTELRAQLGTRPPDAAHDEQIARFIHAACPDHHIRGAAAHVVALNTAQRLLEQHPEIAAASFVTRVITGDLGAVRRMLDGDPALARTRAGTKNWEPILYLCYTRLSLPAVSDNAVAIARLLLDHGADPNAWFDAGESRYTPLVGVIGEGEEDRPAHPQRNALTRLLLERGANPYDIQVIYNTGFHGRVLWFLEMIHEQSVRDGKEADWDDPDWSMLDMGGYGSGARWMLDIAVRDRNLELAEWALAHGASANAPPARARQARFPKLSLRAYALREGLIEMASLFERYGARREETVLDDRDAFTAAVLAGDEPRARAIAARHPEYVSTPDAMAGVMARDEIDAVRLLLDLGMSPNASGHTGDRPLHHAAYSGALRVARLLLERGAEVDPVESTYGGTPLGWAQHANQRAMIDLLAPLSRDVWNLTVAGRTERLRELFRENPELARLTTHDGHTPLMWLPQDDESRALEIAMLYLAHGADTTRVATDGTTAVARAERVGMPRVAELLRAAPVPE